MRHAGVMKPTLAKWASPAVSVLQEEDMLSFCFDYEGLNAVAVGDVRLLPRVEDSSNSL